MILDMRTLILLNFVIAITNILIIFLLWRQTRREFHGISLFILALLCQATGYYLIYLRGVIPDVVSIVLANVILAGAAVIILIGLQKFFQKESSQFHNFLFLGMYTIGFSYFTIVDSSLPIRDMILSGGILFISTQTFYFLTHKVDAPLKSIAKFPAMVLLAYVCLHAGKILIAFNTPIHGTDFFDAGMVSSMIMILYLVLSVLMTASFVLMINGRLHSEVEKQKKKYNSLFYASPYAVIITNLNDGRIMEVNDSFVRLMGYSEDEVVGETTLALNLWSNSEAINEKLKKLAEFKKLKGLEVELLKKNGESMTGLLSCKEIYLNEEKCILTSIGDITEISSMKKMLKDIALHDSLTGLPNRLLFYDRLELGLTTANREDKKAAVVFIDLDHLKEINDTYGHDVGDRILVEAGKKFRYALRKVDTVARFGGDEFVLLLWDVGNRGNVGTVIKNIQEKLAEPILAGDQKFNIEASMGIAMYPDDADNKDDLINKADKAMYMVKRRGRGDFSFYSDIEKEEDLNE